jgi:hypothetical protein
VDVGREQEAVSIALAALAPICPVISAPWRTTPGWSETSLLETNGGSGYCLPQCRSAGHRPCGRDPEGPRPRYLYTDLITDSALIVFLPLIGAVVGAVGSAWANSWYRDWEAKKERDQELKGLTLLVFTELGHNDGLFQMFEQHPDSQDLFPPTKLQTDVWVASRVRLAQLLPNEHTATLTRYYGKIQDVLDIYNNPTLHNDMKTKFLSEDVKKAQKYGKAAMMHGSKYMFVDYPEFTDEKHAKFVEKARKLKDQ